MAMLEPWLVTLSLVLVGWSSVLLMRLVLVLLAAVLVPLMMVAVLVPLMMVAMVLIERASSLRSSAQPDWQSHDVAPAASAKRSLVVIHSGRTEPLTPQATSSGRTDSAYSVVDSRLSDSDRDADRDRSWSDQAIAKGRARAPCAAQRSCDLKGKLERPRTAQRTMSGLTSAVQPRASSHAGTNPRSKQPRKHALPICDRARAVPASGRQRRAEPRERASESFWANAVRGRRHSRDTCKFAEMWAGKRAALPRSVPVLARADELNNLQLTDFVRRRPFESVDRAVARP